MPDRPPNSFEALTRTEWRAWLIDNHAHAANVWLITYKKAAPQPTLSYDDAVTEALCFGWIDSVPRKLDADRTMLYFAPRQARSGWSRVNKERIERAIAARQMTAAGLAKIEAAKADGSWSALDDIENLVEPDDLAAALAQYPPAQTHWQQFPRSTKRGILEWIANAKRETTRAKRVNETARLAQKNERANQWKPKGKRS